jgi:hypothetical protein
MVGVQGEVVVGQARSRCYICRNADGTTADHVFPRQLFHPPRPDNLITAPACEGCQKALQTDEDYFRFFITGTAYGHDEARKIWDGPMRRAFRRPQGRPFYEALLALSTEVVTQTDEGPKQTLAFTADWDRFRPVFFKILRGLHWHHRQQLLGDEVRLRVDFQTDDHPLPPDVIMVVGDSPWFKLGNVVYYSWACFDEDPRHSMAMVMFYGRSQFLISSSVQDDS